MLFPSCFRVLLDRADADSICQSLDSDPEPQPLAPPLASSPLRNPNASTSETDTSDPASSSRLPSSLFSMAQSSRTPLDLSQILLNIKSCRWRHFRPRTLSHHPLGGGDFSRRGFRDFSRTASGLTRTLSGGTSSHSRTGPAPMPVNGESLVYSVFAALCFLVRFGFVHHKKCAADYFLSSEYSVQFRQSVFSTTDSVNLGGISASELSHIPLRTPK